MLLSGQFSSYQAVFYYLQSGYFYSASACHSSFNVVYSLCWSFSQSISQVSFNLFVLSCHLSSAVSLIAGIYSAKKKGGHFIISQCVLKDTGNKTVSLQSFSLFRSSLPVARWDSVPVHLSTRSLPAFG